MALALSPPQPAARTDDWHIDRNRPNPSSGLGQSALLLPGPGQRPARTPNCPRQPICHRDRTRLNSTGKDNRCSPFSRIMIIVK